MRISDWSSDVCSSDLAARYLRTGANRWRGLFPAAVPGGAADSVSRVRGDHLIYFRLHIYRYRHRIHTDTGRPSQQYPGADHAGRSEEHTSELQSLMRISYAVFCLKKKKTNDIL